MNKITIKAQVKGDVPQVWKFIKVYFKNLNNSNYLNLKI